MTETWTIPNVPLFQAGTRHGEEWTQDDLLAMARNAKVLECYVRPPIGLGHEDRTDQPKLGQIENVRVGYEVVDGMPVTTLFGDLTRIPPPLAEPIRHGLYDSLSIEADRITIAPSVYAEPPEGCEAVQGPILRAVGLLGRTLPQVKTLGNLSELMRDHGQVTHSQFSEKLAARPKARLHATKVEKANDGRILSVFSEVRPVTTPANHPAKPASKTVKPLSQWSDKGKAAWKKFADGAAMGTPTNGVSRDDLISILGDSGADTSCITDVVPDAILAEWVRTLKMTDEQPPPAPPAPGGAPSTFSEATMVASLKKEFNEQLSAMQKKLDEMTAVAGSTTAVINQAQLDAKLTGARAFCEKLSTVDHKLPPALVPGAIEILVAADASTKRQFSEGQVSLFDKLRTWMESFPKAHFGEQVQTKPGEHTDKPPTEEDKVRQFAEKNPNLLKQAGRDVKSFCETFAKMREKNPNFTAKDYGVV